MHKGPLCAGESLACQPAMPKEYLAWVQHEGPMITGQYVTRECADLCRTSLKHLFFFPELMIGWEVNLPSPLINWAYSLLLIPWVTTTGSVSEAEQFAFSVLFIAQILLLYKFDTLRESAQSSQVELSSNLSSVIVACFSSVIAAMLHHWLCINMDNMRARQKWSQNIGGGLLYMSVHTGIFWLIFFIFFTVGGSWSSPIFPQIVLETKEHQELS